MDLHLLLSKLQKVRKNGQGKYMACCPAHPDRNPSLSIKVKDDRILMHCFAGCETHDVLAAIGLEMRDIMGDNYRFTPHSKPEKPEDHGKVWARSVLALAKGRLLTLDDQATVEQAKKVLGLDQPTDYSIKKSAFADFDGRITSREQAENILYMADVAREKRYPLTTEDMKLEEQAYRIARHSHAG